MSDPKERLKASLFRSTSAFVTPVVQPPVAVVPTPQTRSPSEQLKKVASLIEAAQFLDIADPDLTALLDEALEEAQRHA